LPDVATIQDECIVYSIFIICTKERLTVKDDKKVLLDEIELYVRYAVGEQDLEMAQGLIKSYGDNERVLRLLREYYTVLPEAREEPVCKVSCLMEQGGVGLFVVVTTGYGYLYVISPEEVLLVSEYQKEVPLEVLSFFGITSQAEFVKQCPKVEELEAYGLDDDGTDSTCPACGVADGEEHLLGCVIEICPWCAGTLSKCNCRFEQLKVEEIEDEEQLEEFTDLLTAKGRIPYVKEQKVTYPGTSEGLDTEDGDEE